MNTPAPRFLAGALAALIATAGLTAAIVGSPPDILRWVRYAAPIFPPELAHSPVFDGFADVVFTFDDSGNILDTLVTKASHPTFTVAVLEASRHWQIDTRELAPGLRRETLRYEFQRRGALITMTNREATKAVFSPYGDLAAMAVSTCREDEIDEPLQLVFNARFEYPPDLKAREVRGHATVSFIVDALGRVRVPTITSTVDKAFGEAAIATLRQWKFAPPQRGGAPVQVLVERTVVFGARERDQPPAAR